jgi:hypothetical protein
MKKIIIAILLMFVFSGVYAQSVTVQEGSTKSTPVISAKFTDVDSVVATNIYVSNWFDLTALQGQTIYLTDSLYSVATTTADTVLVIIQGRFSVPNTGQYFQVNQDTITVFSNVVAQNTLSLSSYAPESRFLVKNKTTTVASQNRNNKVLWLNLFGNTTNYLRPHKNYGNLP